MRFKLLDLDTLAMDHVEGRRQTGPIVDFVIAMALGRIRAAAMLEDK